jgi:DegV family protein with EDD domain
MNPVILIDSCADLPYSYVKEHNIPVIHFMYRFRGWDHLDDFGQSMDYRTFYNGVRNGEMSTTTQVNAETYAEFFTPHVKEKRSIIYLCFSSALSGSYNSAVLARSMLLEKYPDADITIIDTRSASMGEGLLIWYAVDLLEKGAGKDEIIQWVESNKPKLAHWFTISDLNHLRRGGRISGTSAFIGTMMDIKPILHVDEEGRLIPVFKVKGRKKSVRALFEKMEETIVHPEDQILFISHGDAEADANHLADMIRSKYKVKDIWIHPMGPVIGAHAGPDSLCLFFLADKR